MSLSKGGSDPRSRGFGGARCTWRRATRPMPPSRSPERRLVASTSSATNFREEGTGGRVALSHGSPVWSLACGYLTTAPEILPATPAQAAGVLRWTPNCTCFRGVPLELISAMSSADNPLAVEHLPVALVFERRRRHDSILCLRSLGLPLDRKRPIIFVGND
jgi:hypothetical protein